METSSLRDCRGEADMKILSGGFKLNLLKQVSPRLHKHIKNIEAFKFGMSTLVIRWMLQKNKGKINSDGKMKRRKGIDDDDEEDCNKECEDKNNKPEMFTRVAREVKNCRMDLKELSDAIVEQLETRFANCYPDRQSYSCESRSLLNAYVLYHAFHMFPL